ncbi:MFS transporter [Streptomyces avermitilis]|uniref:Transmembrane efflux protein n=2 Tax=Streptomyces avermitilis TaxID=33903 RepID=Q82GL0_STRAW|nr:MULTISPECIES: MFS transporter [Streptomyces]KUN57013.1 MFS transporter [Streptomyces avermitilis]MYS99481.1 DHA2 family efflux MFS transporter permease subunit [Streptomyces sp. SID5469]OOV32262.1 MFS transporter [Streptomyces avermitilis]BAC71599.1 putative transmembrane efflux protein [Streptomyces avermitilis MA-4680 = NBRC 14893]BBJ51835.1 MFS transporter [Streptomyces avermitilis]
MSADSTAVVAPAGPDTSGAGSPSAGRHLGLALVVIAAAQLMVVLDATITNIALPAIQTDLGVSDANLAWIVNSYALAFGGLLLLGGKAGDLFGRRKMFQVGIAVFTLASLLGGLAPNEGLLIAARILQGVGAALAAPSALALITTTFPVGKPRNTAMGVYAAMGGVGATVGLLLGGTLTDVLDWRWVFFVNIPIGLAVLAGTRTLVEAERHPGRLDVPGAIAGTGGLIALVHGITRGGEHGWTGGLTLASFAAAAVLLAAFLWLQARTAHPMMPLRLFKNRSRSGSYATMLFIGAGMFATFYFLTLYAQLILGYSPVRTGFAFLPFSFGMAAAAGVSSKLVARFAPRVIAGPGLLVAAVGMFWFATLEPDSSYAGHLMPAMFVTALGLGMSFVPMTLGAVSGVSHEDTGVASALLNTAQQIGGALGLAVLSTVSTSAADDKLPEAAGALYRGLAAKDSALVAEAGDALTHGYTMAFAAAAGMFLAGLAVTALAVNAGKQRHVEGAAPVHMG